MAIRRKFIKLNAYIRKKEKSQIGDLSIHLKKLKPTVRRKKKTKK